MHAEETEDLHTKNVQPEISLNDITQTFLELSRLRQLEQKYTKLTISPSLLEDNDTKTKYYTGLESYSL